MALARVKTWVQEILTAADLNAEFDNILNNPISLISPLVSSLNVGLNSLTNVANVTTTGSAMGILVGGINSLTLTTVAANAFLQTESNHATTGPNFTFYHNNNPINGQVSGIINWVAKSGGVNYLVGAHYVTRSAAEDASAMYSIHTFTTQNAANQVDANVAATLTAAGVWTDASSARIKDYTGEAMDGVFEKLRGMTTLGVYRGKGAPVGSEIHYSPTAEEFYSVFGLGNDPQARPELAGIAPKDVAWLGIKALMEVEQRVAKLEGK